jgi:hypothetical protein
VKVALASFVPVLVQRLADMHPGVGCVLVEPQTGDIPIRIRTKLKADLYSRIVGILTSWNRASFQILQGQVGPAAVVKDQVKLLARALPAWSFTRGSVAPPLTVAV